MQYFQLHRGSYRYCYFLDTHILLLIYRSLCLMYLTKVSLSDNLLTGHNVYLCSVFDLNFLVLTGTASKDLQFTMQQQGRKVSIDFYIDYFILMSLLVFKLLIFLPKLSPFVCLCVSECFGLHIFV